ncbi:MAG: LacI family transcriptional regulator [Lachnospiraceae bacterium]|nr:LacI family transcriptional regulator [Lachnospiraceae bacterium]
MVSMKEIAAACGVSVATVSKALSDHHDIGEKTKQHVREVADQMGYLPNLSARYLKTNRSYNLGVLFEDAAQSGLTHDFFSGVLESLKNTAQSRGYDITFLNTLSPDMSYVERALYRGFDGVAIACFDFSNPKVQELLSSSVKVVTVDYIADNRTAVVSDNVDGMTRLMDYILSQGHTRIAYIHGDEGRVTRQRLASYCRSLGEHGIGITEEYIKPALYRDRQLTYDRTMELLSLGEPPTCIIYPDDVAAFGGFNAIRARGLQFPEDISVAGYDGIRMMQYMEPRLTTVRQDMEALGRLAAESLIDEIEHPMATAPTIHTVEGQLLKGQTVRRI